MTLPMHNPAPVITDLTVKNAQAFRVGRFGVTFDVVAVEVGPRTLFACQCAASPRCSHVRAVKELLAQRAEDARPDVRCGSCGGLGSVEARSTRSGWRECRVCGGRGRVPKNEQAAA